MAGENGAGLGVNLNGGDGADTIVGGDLGCLLHLAGRIARKGETIAVRHAAEILAGIGETPAIGEENT